MSILVNIQKLCKENNTSVPKLEKELGFGNGSIYNWDKSSPSVDKLQKVAEYFNVSTDFLLGKLSPIEERDIAKDVEKMLSDLANDEEISFQGEPMDEDEREMLRISIENSLRLFKQMSKKKFNDDAK